MGTFSGENRTINEKIPDQAGILGKGPTSFSSQLVAVVFELRAEYIRKMDSGHWSPMANIAKIETDRVGQFLKACISGREPSQGVKPPGLEIIEQCIQPYLPSFGLLEGLHTEWLGERSVLFL